MTAAPQTAPPAEPQSLDAGTEYIVLESGDGGDTWKISGQAVARDASQAIRQHLKGLAEVDAMYAAVPARSWRPVKVKTKIELEFGDAS